MSDDQLDPMRDDEEDELGVSPSKKHFSLSDDDVDGLGEEEADVVEGEEAGAEEPEEDEDEDEDWN